jgi:hypothetical protein
MKDLSRNSMKKDEKKCKGKNWRTFIKNYFLEILGIIIILVLLFALLNGRRRSINYNTKNPSSIKVSKKEIVQKNNSKSIEVSQFNKNTYELNKEYFDLFINKYESQGIFRIKPSDILEGNTIVQFSYKVYLIRLIGNKEIIDNIVFRFISKYNNLLEKVEENGNSITLYIRRKENFSFYINLKNKEKISKNFIKNDPLFYIEYQESTAE